jgi:hypothetical protein
MISRQDAIKNLEPTLADHIQVGNGDTTMIKAEDQVIYSPTTAAMNTPMAMEKLRSQLL